MKEDREAAVEIKVEERVEPKKARLTAANLEKNSEIISKQAESRPPTSQSKKNKPAWARTEEQLHHEEEEEIDDLIEFAYDLDYEQYVEDTEIRQALAIIKDRVNEIKQDEEWKEKLDRESHRDARIKDLMDERRDDDGHSVADSTYSTKSLRDEVREKILAEEKDKPDWDTSTQAGNNDRKDPEQKLARRLAEEVLDQNPVSIFVPDLLARTSKISIRSTP